ncbi:hypothetical protein G7K_0917-t1 [Saitoella complicata NRRL Y-17804]|uniref:Peroxin/Ferlin domain-containing protein n=1 Tax=Saitoella complicata (strain BCRC 22490 / CBS 7301 / JCM 7358 / NBRC 10748 / NRRL Y-17804) TaxID=698492 RepID=A0A0E9NA71_SAICN|nr:hypothetical protein G7K_0917-t1 [Saitoella complicata NRRL Y-17804]
MIWERWWRRFYSRRFTRAYIHDNGAVGRRIHCLDRAHTSVKERAKLNDFGHHPTERSPLLPATPALRALATHDDIHSRRTSLASAAASHKTNDRVHIHRRVSKVPKLMRRKKKREPYIREPHRVRVEDHVTGRHGWLGGVEDDTADEDEIMSAQEEEIADDASTRMRTILSPRSRATTATFDGTDIGGEEQEEVDVLYENQRGCFFCGIPLFSSAGLLNFDPSPWTRLAPVQRRIIRSAKTYNPFCNPFKKRQPPADETASIASGRWRGVQTRHVHSPVTVADAQPPDPTWTWAWPRWFVDMSQDVDDNGWSYSFQFHGTRWHGTHIWFQSFVRRRRWVRKRTRQLPISTQNPLQQSDGSRISAPVEDYWTVYSAAERESRFQSMFAGPDDGGPADDDDEDIRDVNALERALKRARLDREKITALRNFLHDAPTEISVLAPRIPTLLSTFVFQSSRTEVLKLLVAEHDRLHAHMRRNSCVNPDAGGWTGHSELEGERERGLGEAVRAAEEFVGRGGLEYWSDVRNVVEGPMVPRHDWDCVVCGDELNDIAEADVEDVDEETEHEKEKSTEADTSPEMDYFTAGDSLDSGLFVSGEEGDGPMGEKRHEVGSGSEVETDGYRIPEFLRSGGGNGKESDRENV